MLLLKRCRFLLLFCLFGGCAGNVPQSFRVRPQNVSVIEGHDALLRCEVQNQMGDAQWTKQGLALGFNRSIPGFDHLEMEGDASQNIHNLRIRNVSLEDDGDYQCQVTPFGISPAIRDEAHLTVLVPPDGIRLTSPKTVESGKAFDMECHVTNAKPAAKIAWYKGEKKLPKAKQTDEVLSSKAVRKTTRSKIRVTPLDGDNGVVYKCVAVHAALEKTMSRNVTLDVQYPPGSPYIENFSENQYFLAGTNKTLTCKARGGNPMPEIYWYKNGHQVDRNYRRYRNYVINDYHFLPDADDNNATLECHVHNLMTSQPLKNKIRLQVMYPPSKVIIKAPEMAKTGDLINISCTARKSNPAAEVTLVVGSNQESTTGSQQSENGGGYDTVTKISKMITPNMRENLTVQCFATNRYFKTDKRATKTVVILRPPSAPIITGYDGAQLKKGEHLALTCTTTGGNPSPNITWYKNDRVVITGRSEFGNSILNVELQESDNRAVYRCDVENSATLAPLSTNVTLSVLFPPADVSIALLESSEQPGKNTDPSSAQVGDMIDLVCQSSAANPPANITWSTNGSIVQSVEESPMPVGFITKSVLKFKVGVEDDGRGIQCEAHNGFFPSAHDTLRLKVLYAPVWEDKLEKTYTAKEGENLTLAVEAKGKPPEITYKWIREGQVISVGDRYNKINVTAADAGNYTIRASNNIGATEAIVQIIIKYKPVVVSLSQNQTLNENDTLNLNCVAHGFPKPKISWKRVLDADEDEGELTSRTEQRGDQVISTATVKLIKKSFMGKYICVASNELGETERHTFVIVSHEPVFDTSSPYQKAAADIGGTALVKCRASGHPNLSFIWYKGSIIIEPGVYSYFEDRYRIKSASQVPNKLTTWESVLEVKNVQTKDYGDLRCQAKSDMGMRSTLIKLEGTGRPDLPTNIKILNKTHESVQLLWTPGFDGGLKQNFRIRYYEDNTNQFKYVDVFPPGSNNFSVEGLSLGTYYVFNILAFNDKGSSAFTKDIRVATQRYASRDEVEIAISRVLAEKANLPRVVTLAVSTVGSLLVVINAVLVACVIRRRQLAKKKDSPASSDKGSNKSTTIEMYAPSSYTGTVNGETLSSISEKSRESYAHEESGDEYDEAPRLPVGTNYLIEQLEPPPQYATRPPPHILPPPSSHKDGGPVSNYDINARRNQYNSALDRVGPYATLGNRGMAKENYSGSAQDKQFQQSPGSYNTYNTQQQNVTSHNHNINTGSLRRPTQAPKLHFPKDYIRNGSMNITSPSARQYVNQLQPGSPTRTNALPVLTTFSSELEGSHVITGVPLEQQGHLV